MTRRGLLGFFAATAALALKPIRALGLIRSPMTDKDIRRILAATPNGGTAKIPKGRYIIHETVLIDRPVTLDLNGSSIVTEAPVGFRFTEASDGGGLMNGNFDGDRSAMPSIAIKTPTMEFGVNR